MSKTTGFHKIFSIVENPAHYVEGRRIEPLSVIEDWSLNFHLGNVVKYISRVDRKGNGLEDLKKAASYLAREIERRKDST